MIFFGIVYHFSMENSYAKLDKSNRQKEILLKEVHHRVKNNLNIISSMLGLQMLREKDNKVKQVFQKNRLRVDSIAMVHEILYQHSDFETIDVHEYLDSLSSMVCEMSDEHITINLKDKVLALPFEMVLKIGILTNELIVNTIKHATSEESKQIFIGFHDEGEYYRYIYQDSGTQKVDLEKLNDTKTLGLKLIHLMVEQLEGTLELSGDRGLVYSIRIPKHV
jgi:two-component sensor histidine kinase